MHSLLYRSHAQHRRLMKAEAVHKYKKRVDARRSLAERRQEDEDGMNVDPLDEIFNAV